MSGEERQSRLAPGFHSPEVLYRGTASTVYRARRDTDDTPVALKVMRDDAGAGEADRLVELSGTPGLVTAVGGGRTSSGRAFVAMELHPEGDYASALEARSPLPLEEVLVVGRSVARALTALHGRGLLHHRIEPGNILKAPHGAVLADVGGVLPMDRRPEPVGLDPHSVAYASPEALGGAHPLTPASDVYRLAVVLWTLLAGHPPFAQGPGALGDPFAYRERVLAEDPPRLPRADLPAWLRALLDQALSRDPAERHDAVAFAEALGSGVPEPGTAAAGPVGAAGSPNVPEAVETGSETDPGVGASAERTPAPPREEPPLEDTRPSDDAPSTAENEGAGSGRHRGLGEDGPAPVPTGGSFADHPELAWSSLPGWAGTATSTAAPLADPTPAPASPGEKVPEHGADRTPHPVPPPPPEPPRPPEVGPRPSGPPPRRPLFIGVTVAAIAFVALSLGAVAVLRPGLGGDLLERAASSDPSPAATDVPDERGEGSVEPPPGGPESAEGDGATPRADLVETVAPTDVVLEDTGHTVLVTWTDNTDPAADHQVIGGPAGETPGNLAAAEPGSGQARVSGLEPDREYCFVVIAVLSVDEIAPSEQACTERADTA